MPAELHAQDWLAPLSELGYAQIAGAHPLIAVAAPAYGPRTGESGARAATPTDN